MLKLRIRGCEWDHGNLLKCLKHGLDLNQIESFFRGKIHVAPDLRHSSIEQRFIALGRASGGRPMIVAFTFRQRGGHL